MGDVIELDGGRRVDVASQKILIRLRGSDWTYSGDLRKATELSQNSQVLYRLEQHLMPADLVIEADRDREEEPRKFQLSASGQIWVDDHEEELEYPASRAETQEMAYEAVEAAESARESVQNYRKKLYQVRQRVEELEEIEERVEKNATELGYHSGSLQGLRDRKADEKSVANVTGEFDEFRDEIEEKHEAAVDRLDAQEIAVDDLSKQVRVLRNENAYLRSKVEEMREEMDRGVIERLGRYFRGRLEQVR